MSSRSIRSILALATLTAGVSWLAIGTAQAATHCGKAVAVLEAPTTVAALCDEATDVRASGNYGGKMSAPADSELLTNVDMLAKVLGLPGLSRAAAVLSVADLAGVAAGAGLPTLPGGLPGKAGLADVTSLAELPDVPGLPNVPAALPVAGLPALPVGKLPALPDATGLTSVKAPLKLPQPITEVKDKVTAVVPQVPAAVKKVESAVPQSSNTGIGGLLKGLNLG